MESLERKKIGKFIPKGHALLKAVSLKEFTFKSIGDQQIAEYDNPSGNLIYLRYHSEEELKATVSAPKHIESDVREPENRPILLQPIDFTADWRRQQERASKRRRGRSDDDDELELEYELEMIEKQLRTSTGASESSENISPQKERNPHPVESHDPNVQIAQLQDLETGEKIVRESQISPLPPKDMEGVGDLISSVAAKTGVDALQSPLVIQKPSPIDPSPVIHSSEQVNFEVFRPENAALKQYRDALEMPDLKPEEISTAIESAKNDGYLSGFRHGEEKGSLQLKESSGPLLDSLAKIRTELEHLRRSVLEGAEQNFYEICQALAEGLIGHELQTNPTGFKELVQKIVREHIGEDSFKIYIHPDFRKNLQILGPTGLEENFVDDPELKLGDFRVESVDAVIDGNLHQMIRDLLKQADLKLFASDHSKAS